ncbi:hypothetical protein L484_023063 [Morus notabilis]|uniref:Uncharacterized protein n=1 Tax=Morus notabilis TaxID=981085 RepID=W9RUC7_9ROSA|nr:hypothetical protein L484_023063 [Morus notabilis]
MLMAMKESDVFQSRDWLKAVPIWKSLLEKGCRTVGIVVVSIQFVLHKVHVKPCTLGLLDSLHGDKSQLTASDQHVKDGLYLALFEILEFSESFFEINLFASHGGLMQKRHYKSVDDSGDKERRVPRVSGEVVVRAKSSSSPVRIFQPFWHQRFKSFGNDFPVIWQPLNTINREVGLRFSEVLDI